MKVLILYKLAKKYGVDIKGITFKRIWMPMGNAMFCVLAPNTVWLNKKSDDWAMIDEVAHELIHRDQYTRDGLIRYIFIKVYGRLMGWLIGNPYENEAYAEQDRIDMVKRGI